MLFLTRWATAMEDSVRSDLVLRWLHLVTWSLESILKRPEEGNPLSVFIMKSNITIKLRLTISELKFAMGQCWQCWQTNRLLEIRRNDSSLSIWKFLKWIGFSRLYWFFSRYVSDVCWGFFACSVNVRGSPRDCFCPMKSLVSSGRWNKCKMHNNLQMKV